LQALIDAQRCGKLPNARIVLVLSNRKAAHGLVRASSHSIPTAYLALKPFLEKEKEKRPRTRDDYDGAVAEIVVGQRPDLVVLAGWMHVFGERFLEAMGCKGDHPIPVINLHPALPGAFDGTHAIQRAYEAFRRGEITHSGVMVHRVVKEVDRGEPVLVREVEMKQGESIEEFEKRVHDTEWVVIVQAVAKMLNL
jgi:phosphoribosylglycinamide formyltransferase